MYAQLIAFNDITVLPQKSHSVCLTEIFHSHTPQSLFMVSSSKSIVDYKGELELVHQKSFENMVTLSPSLGNITNGIAKSLNKIDISLPPITKNNPKQVAAISPNNTTTKSNKKQHILPFILG